MAPTINYSEELANWGLYFEPEGMQRLLRIDGQEMQRMAQEEFEKVGDLVNGYV